MYFWRIRNLVRRLIERDLTETEAFQYYFANSVVLAIASELPGEKWNLWDAFGAISTLIVTITGLLIAFVANGGGAGQSFLARFNAISWVIFLRFLSAMFLVMIPALIVMEVLGRSSEVTSWWEAVLFVLVEILLYARIITHIKRVRRGRDLHNESQNSSSSAIPSGQGPYPDAPLI